MLKVNNIKIACNKNYIMTLYFIFHETNLFIKVMLLMYMDINVHELFFEI